MPRTMQVVRVATSSRSAIVPKNDPDHEHEFSRHIGGMLRSTYWMEYKSEMNMFALSRDWIRSDYYTEEELLECYEGYWWNLTC